MDIGLYCFSKSNQTKIYFSQYLHSGVWHNRTSSLGDKRMKFRPMSKKEMALYGLGGVVVILLFIGLMMWMMGYVKI